MAPNNKPEDDDMYAALRKKVPEFHSFSKETFPYFTSLMAATVRALEAEREGSLLNDWLAKPLAGEAFQYFGAFETCKKGSDGNGYVVFRHALIDEDIVDNLTPDIHQVVLIGAGMDTRSYRLKQFADCHVFELDGGKDLVAYKKRILQEQDANLIVREHDVVVTDLTKYSWPDELVMHGFDPKQPTLWIAEALLMYLDRASLDRLLKTIDQLSAPNSQAYMDMCGNSQITMNLAKVGNDATSTFVVDPVTQTSDFDMLSAMPWTHEMLIQRIKGKGYRGKRWDPKRFAFYDVPLEQVYIPEWFLVHSTKPSAV